MAKPYKSRVDKRSHKRHIALRKRLRKLTARVFPELDDILNSPPSLDTSRRIIMHSLTSRNPFYDRWCPDDK
jgi:hypothetical protein